MSSIFKFLRITFFLALYFLIAMLFVVTALQSWPVGWQMLFAFASPAIVVFWQEKRRSGKATSMVATEKGAPPRTVPIEPTIKQTDLEARIDRYTADTRAGITQDPAAVVKNDATSKPEVAKEPTPSTLYSTPAKQTTQPQPTPSARSHKNGWLGAGETIRVAGRDIGGMIYVGAPPLVNTDRYRGKCRAYIDPSLSVARSGSDLSGADLPYWPSYSDISSKCRATYLDWLAAGRSDSRYDAGYMFLYFYGLERRFFVEQPNEDAEEIIREVRRLQALYADNHSVRRYLGEFLDMASMIKAFSDLNALEPIFVKQGWELPVWLKYAIGARIDKGENLSGDWLLSWFISHPEGNLRTSATRCRDEFTALFKLRFLQRFPDGLKITKPRKTLKLSYSAASSEFETTITPHVNGKPVPDISGLRKPIEIAQEIADEVMNELDKLSRFLARNPDGRGSVEAHALLPRELWHIFPSAEMDSLKSWVGDIVNKGGLVVLSDVVARLEGSPAEKIGKRQLTGAADALARLGFGLAPDPRFALRAPKSDEPVVLFTLGEAVERLEDVSDRYRAVLMELALGTFIAHADGRIAEAERAALEERVKALPLDDEERRKLRANLEWMFAVPPDMTVLRRKLKELDAESQASMRAALVSAAHADGVIHSAEVASIEMVYKALGLDPSLAYSDLHAGEVGNGPRKVREVQPAGPGEKIPEPESPSLPKLDAARIAAIRSDTERVSSVLGQIFDADESDPDASLAAKQSRLVGLDAKHAALVLDLVDRPHWSEAEFTTLCASHGLMSSGALEAVNEWAFGIYDEALLEEYNGYDVSPEISAAVTDQMVAEG